MALTEAQRVPASTYRVQLNAQFTFGDLERIVPYLHALGITDVYCSPILFSTPGSTHGYDVSDYRKINPELGGWDGLVRLSEKLRAAGMGVLLDFVPNHMGINGPFNPWWRNVLESGRQSPYARFFDIQWNEDDAPEKQRILVPILGDHYGITLEKGELQLRFEQGGLVVAYYDTRFPLRPASYAKVFEPLADAAGCPPELATALREIVQAVRELPRAATPGQEIDTDKRTRDLAALKKHLAEVVAGSVEAGNLLARRLAEINGRPGVAGSYDQLDDLLGDQHYRLARWKAGAHETNYRRFFAVDTLIGLRMENQEVFFESHLLLSQLILERHITGLRIDHIDGLWDPHDYLARLQGLAPPAEPGEPAGLYVLVEKILEGEETLPANWPMHGTTGYEFAGQLARLFTDKRGHQPFSEVYGAFAGQRQPYDDLVYEKKRLVLEEMFANAVNTLTARLHTLLLNDRRWRDLTAHELATAIREIMAGFTIYRTYRRIDDERSAADEHAITEACERALRRNRRLDPQPFEFVRDLLIGRYPATGAPAGHVRACVHWVLTFQQYTGAIMAKSVEDTAFYIFNQLIALNEVGGDPAAFGGTIEEFHQANAARLAQMPHSMLTTSTHDTKLSEDVRARLYALSEIPEEWNTWLQEWRALNAPLKARVEDRQAPDANEEYRLYQVLLGAWPLSGQPDDEFRQRIREHVRKAVNEAKTNTTWIEPNEGWLEAGDRFVDGLLASGAGNAFLQSFTPKAARLAHLGMVNSLAQVILKLTAPGVPDLYQGNEIWDFSLVDPDNRRPVDYARRQALLEQVAARSPRELLKHWRDGGIKLRVTEALLNYRRERPQLFTKGDYRPLAAQGRYADNVIGYARSLDEEALVVVVPRLFARIGCPPLGLAWEETRVRLPMPGRWSELFTGRELHVGDEVEISELFADLPFAVLIRITTQQVGD